MKNSLVKIAFVNALGTVVYIAIVAMFFNATPVLFGEFKNNQTIIIPIMMLTLFVISAAITGSLVLGKPILLYFDGQKQDAVRLFLYTLGFMAIAFLIVATILLLMPNVV